MLYKVGLKKEVLSLSASLPDEVLSNVFQAVVILDAEYGEDRNYLESGGYAIIAETDEDIAKVVGIVGKDCLSEWVKRIGNTKWISVLYLLGDDFSVVLYAPESVVPSTTLKELEE